MNEPRRERVIVGAAGPAVPMFEIDGSGGVTAIVLLGALFVMMMTGARP